MLEFKIAPAKNKILHCLLIKLKLCRLDGGVLFPILHLINVLRKRCCKQVNPQTSYQSARRKRIFVLQEPQVELLLSFFERHRQPKAIVNPSQRHVVILLEGHSKPKFQVTWNVSKNRRQEQRILNMPPTIAKRIPRTTLSFKFTSLREAPVIYLSKWFLTFYPQDNPVSRYHLTWYCNASDLIILN